MRLGCSKLNVMFSNSIIYLKCRQEIKVSYEYLETVHWQEDRLLMHQFDAQQW